MAADSVENWRGAYLTFWFCSDCRYPLKIPQGGRECDFVAKVLQCWFCRPFWPYRVTSLTSRWPEHITTKSNSQPHFFKTNFQEGAQIQLYKIPNQDEGLRFENAEISLRVFSTKACWFCSESHLSFPNKCQTVGFEELAMVGWVGFGPTICYCILTKSKTLGFDGHCPITKLQTLHIS